MRFMLIRMLDADIKVEEAMLASIEENRNTIIAEIHRARHIPVEELQNKWTQELIDIVC